VIDPNRIHNDDDDDDYVVDDNVDDNYKSQLPQRDPRDALHHAHGAGVHKGGRSVSVIN